MFLFVFHNKKGMFMQYEGKCLCEQVVLKTEQACHQITAYHCMMSKKRNSSPLMNFIGK